MTSIKPSCPGSVSNSRETTSRAGYQGSRSPPLVPANPRAELLSPCPGRTQEGIMGARGQAACHQATRKQRLPGWPSGAHHTWACPLLPLPCCLPLVNVDLQLQPQHDGPSPLGCLRAGPVGHEPELQGRGADRPVLTCYLTLGKLPPPSQTSGKTNRVEIEVQEAVILFVPL